MCDIVVKKVTFAISSPDEFLYQLGTRLELAISDQQQQQHAKCSVYSVTFRCAIYSSSRARAIERETVSQLGVVVDLGWV